VVQPDGSESFRLPSVPAGVSFEAAIDRHVVQIANTRSAGTDTVNPSKSAMSPV
jgi:hypothetical protein